MNDHTIVAVGKIPPCDICGKPATVDGKTVHGPWANMCDDHYQALGIGLGPGYGQRLVLR